MSDKSYAVTQGRRTAIRDLNDAMRRNFLTAPWRVPGAFKILVTPGARGLDENAFARLLLQVAAFCAFTADNDPYGEHDFGAVELQGEQFFWKIAYYDRAGEMFSPDPTDPAVTLRVLTIMRADEY